MLACPADSTKRSRSGHLGLVGLCRRWRVHKTSAIGAAPKGIPGCPEFAFWTASIDSVRMVLMRRATIGCGRQAARCSGTNGAFGAVSAISADGADRFFWIWCRKRCNRSVCRARLATYLERRCCELPQHAATAWRPAADCHCLMCAADGCPVAVEVFEGNTADPMTLSSQIDKLEHRFKQSSSIG